MFDIVLQILKLNLCGSLFQICGQTNNNKAHYPQQSLVTWIAKMGFISNAPPGSVDVLLCVA